ncbi:MAG: Crp/Fnr family transcriptional regulator [Bacteroidetes bacterium]|nr:Crp/Fnr family transcriptional regulator [Bacteroidota bacterium]
MDPRIGPDTVAAIAANVARTIALDAEELALFASVLRLREHPRKAVLLSRGEVCRTMHYVVEGCIKVFNVDDEGVEHVVKFAPEDWWAFDIESFALGVPCSYGIEAIEATRTLGIGKDDMEMLYRRVPKFERFSRILFQNAYIALQRRVEQSLSLEAGERYAAFRRKYPGLEARIPQKLVASYLGVTPEFLSTLRRRLLTEEKP